MHYALYFLGIVFRNTSKQSTLEEGVMLRVEMGSEAHFFLNIFYYCKRKVSAFLIDKTNLRIGYSMKHGWLWVAVVEPISK